MLSRVTIGRKRSIANEIDFFLFTGEVPTVSSVVAVVAGRDEDAEVADD